MSETDTQESLKSPENFQDLLEIKNVSKVFRPDILKRPQVAVDRLSLAFRQGACTGLLGHNGAGKSTTIRMILGLIRPDKGAILFRGQSMSPQDRAAIGYMPEVNKLPLALTADEILLNTVRIFAPKTARDRKQLKAHVTATLEQFGLTAHRHKRVGQLSKGLARRLALAQALIHDPPCLILDEPSTGLDPDASEAMNRQIELQKSRGKTIILCTHDLNHVVTLCDDVHLLRRGRLVLTSRPDCHAEDGPIPLWHHSYTVEIESAHGDLLQNLQRHQSLPPWQSLSTKDRGEPSAEDQNITGESRDRVQMSFPDYDTAAPWLAALVAAGIKVRQFGPGRDFTADKIRHYFAVDP